MTPQEFKEWRKRMGLTQAEVAGILDLSKSSVELYERGARRDDDRPVVIPALVELACKNLSRAVLLRQELDALENGRMTTRGWDGSKMVDTTAETAQRTREWLAELDSVMSDIKKRRADEPSS